MEKAKKNRKQIIIGGSILLIVTLLLLGLTYAYYRTRIVGNSNSESVNVLSKDLSVTYQENDSSIIMGTVEPGSEFTKEFSVHNSGEGEATYSIKITGVENTFVRLGDWTYEIKSGSSDGNYNTEVKKGVIPNTDSYLVFNEKVGKGETKYYSFTITYEDLKTEDQSVDMGKKLNFKIDIDNEVGEIFTKEETGANTLLKAIGNNNAIAIKTLTEPGKETSKYTYELGNTINQILDASLYDYDHGTFELTYGTGYTYDEESNKFKLTGVQKGFYTSIIGSLKGKYLATFPGYEDYLDVEPNASTGLDIVYEVVEATEDEMKYKIIYPKGIEAELATTEDDYGNSYYYRGSVENNYVTMGNTCWRIVRVQGNGSIKITLYDEQHSCDTSVETGSGAYMSRDGNGTDLYSDVYSNGDSKTVKFAESKVKSELEKWYGFSTPGIGQKYGNVIEQSAEWCNDVSEADTNDGTSIYFGALKRLDTYNNTPTGPSLKCRTLIENNEESIYTGKIALLTADEVVFAGAPFVNYGSDPNLYLLGNALHPGQFWTMSPRHLCVLGDDYCFAAIYGVMSQVGVGEGAPGWISNFYPHEDSAGVRPSIVLKSNVTITNNGNGTKSNPYVIAQ